MRGEAAQTAFHIPELLEADVCCKTALCNVVIEHLQSNAVTDDGRLAHSDVSKRTGMDQAGLIFCGHHQGGINRIPHPCSHCPCHFKVCCGDGITLLIIGNDNFTKPLPE